MREEYWCYLPDIGNKWLISCEDFSVSNLRLLSVLLAL